MPEQLPVEIVRNSLLTLLTEVMNQVNGYVLDRGTSMFETLTSISAEEASQPVSNQSATLAAQVNHTRFYMDAILAQTEHADWDESWHVGTVDDRQWQDLIMRLHASTEQVRAFFTSFDDWNERYLGGAIALIVHSAYHLGEIRQGIGVIRSRS